MSARCLRTRWRRARALALALALALPDVPCALAEDAAPAGEDAAAAHLGDAVGSVQFSDGRELHGAVELAEPLRIALGDATRVLAQDQVAAIELTPVSEAMDQGWRFAQPGQPKKVPVGKPYPVRHLEAVVTTCDGARTRGHLVATVCWISVGDDQRERVIIPAKQSGEEGQTLADLVYPVRVVVRPSAPAAHQGALALAGGAAPALEAALLTLPALERVELTGGGPRWALGVPAEAPMALACRRADGWHVAWPGTAASADRAQAATAVEAAQDFLDERRLLGAWSPGPAQLFALVLAIRQGPTTLPGPRKPWRLEVWRWARDQDRVLWAGRNYLARGLYANAQELPRVVLESAWWSQAVSGSELVIGGDGHGR